MPSLARFLVPSLVIPLAAGRLPPQGERDGLPRAEPRALADLAPAGTVLWLRGSLPLEPGDLRARLRAVLRGEGRLRRTVPEELRRKLGAALALSEGIERVPLVRALLAIIRGPWAFGLRAGRHGPEQFALVRAKDPTEAHWLERRLRALGAPVGRRGSFVALAPEPACRQALEQAWRHAVRGGPRGALARQLAPLARGGIAGLWLAPPLLRRAAPRFRAFADPLAAFLFAPWPEALRRARGLRAVLRVEGGAWKLEARLEGAAEGLSETLRRVLALDAPQPQVIPEQAGEVLRLRLRRNLQAFFAAAGDWLTPRARRALGRAREDLAFVFGQGSGGRGLPAALGGAFEAVVALSTPADRRARPSAEPDWPLIAAGWPLADRQAARRAFEAVQVFALAAQAKRARAGRSLRRIVVERLADGGRLARSVLVPPRDGRPLPFEAGLEPTLAFGSGRFLFASQATLCRRVLAAGSPRVPAANGRDVLLDEVRVDGAAAARLLLANEGLIAARLALGEGLGREDAHRRLAVLARLGVLAGRLRAALSLRGGDLVLKLERRPAAQGGAR